MLLLSLMPSCQSSADFKSVPEGWTAPEAGYWTDSDSARDTLSALKYYRQRGDMWERSYQELKETTETTIEQLEARVNAVEEALGTERAVWAKAVAAAKAKSRAPRWGFFAGPAVDTDGDVKAVVGIGIVWSPW